jgi:hypothetical protein
MLAMACLMSPSDTSCEDAAAFAMPAPLVALVSQKCSLPGECAAATKASLDGSTAAIAWS